MREGKCRRALVHLIRYADDFIITGRSKELLEQEVKPLVEQFMRERGLQLSPEKTVITHIEEGFDFLGQNVRKYKAGKQYKLLIKPSKKNVKAFLEKVREVVKANKALTCRKTDRQAQPHHSRMGQLSPACGKQGNLQQGRRRDLSRSETMDKTKTPTQIRQMDCEEILHNHRRGQLGVLRNHVDETTRHLLTDTAKVPIKRHRKIQGEANPYDPGMGKLF